MITVDLVLAETQKNDRVCPQPQEWQQLYELLSGKRRNGMGWEPSLPLVLAAWWDAPALSKMLRVREHIEWADTHGALEQVYVFLNALTEEQWHHIGD